MKKAIPLMLMAGLTISFNSLASSKPLVSKDPVFPKINAPLAELGKKLFFDPRLSFDGTISCNSCHNLMSNGSDHRSVSVGVRGQRGGRKAPTVWNSALMSAFFWDGRAKSLEEQATGPLTNPVEMGMPDHKAVEERIRSIPGYVSEFASVFSDTKTPVNITRVALSVAEFERTLITYDSPFDRYQAGETGALSPQAKKGYELVQSVGCTSCHNGRNFSGPELPQGTPFLMKFPVFPDKEYDKKYRLTADTGRHSVTGAEEDRHMWRVPTWRNIETLAPYFHNGSVESLEEAVRVMAKVQLNKTLKDDEVKDIVSFLKSLTGKKPAVSMPVLPETSGLSVKFQS